MEQMEGTSPSAPSRPARQLSEETSAAGFASGDAVVAARQLRVRGTVVVRQGTYGRVVGPAAASGRICVHFERREDASENRLNCLPDEIRHCLAGGFHIGSTVRLLRNLEVGDGDVLIANTLGTVMGPGRSRENAVLVRIPLSGERYKEHVCAAEDLEVAIPGSFRRGNAVIAARDLRVGGNVVVREGVLGTVVGPSSTDALNRVTVSFSHREDNSRNRLNCVVSEIRLYLAGGLEVGTKVEVLRSVSYDGLAPVLIGTKGTVLGPSSQEPIASLRVLLEPPLPPNTPAERELRAEDLGVLIAGGYRQGETVAAAKDLRVKGQIVVKQGIVGTIIGQSNTDPANRITVAFARREDGRCNNLNVVPSEIQRLPCTGGLMPGDRVAATRQLLVVPKGTHGTVVGPSCARTTRVAVRFNPVQGAEEVVLHVESEDLRILHAVGEDVDDTCGEFPDSDDNTEGLPRQAVAGGYNRGETVVAVRDLCVSGRVVARMGVLGTVIGPSSQDPVNRITISFAWREDGKTNNLNVMTNEVRRVEPGSLSRGELCAICLAELVEGEEEICRMPCGHVLHAPCVRTYLNHQTAGGPPTAATALAPLKPAQCPVCRRDVLP